MSMPPLVTLAAADPHRADDLAARLAEHLGRSGRRVARLTAWPHPLPPDLQPGGVPLLLAFPGARLLLSPPVAPSPCWLDWLGTHLPPDLDLLLVVLPPDQPPGPWPRLDIDRPRTQGGPLRLALVSDTPPPAFDGLCLPPGNLDRLADLLTRTIAPTPPGGPRLSLRADGQRVPVKSFVRDTIIGVVRGLLTPLKGCGEARRLELVLQLDDPGDHRPGSLPPPDGLS